MSSLPQTEFPDPRVPSPPGPVPVDVLPGYFARRWNALGESERRAFPAFPAENGLPLVDPDPDGDPGFRAVTFLYHDGDAGGPPATAVILSANALVHQDNLDACELERVPGTAWWALTCRMPADWEASYRITAHTGAGPAPWRTAAGRRAVRGAADAGRPDPRNRELGAAMNGSPQSILRLPKAPASPWLAAATPAASSGLPGTGAVRDAVAGAARDAVTGLQTWSVFDSGADRERTVWVYRPLSLAKAGPAAARATPLLLLHDGQVWAKYLNLRATLDAAIGSGVVPPLHVAMIDSLDTETRSRELSGPVGTVDFVAADLLPRLRSELPVLADPASTLISGASYGGLAALWQVARFPDQVGTALAQSPSVWRYDLSTPLAAVLNPAAEHPVRVSIQAGRYETAIHAPAVALARELSGVGGNLRFRSITGGHDWAWWNPWLIRGLAELLNNPAPAGRFTGIAQG